MKLKYKSISTNVLNKESTTFETAYVDFKEETKDQFIVLDFSDGKNNHHLEISSEEIYLEYANQKVHMILDSKVPNEYKGPKGKIFYFDWHLETINIGLKQISFFYNISVQNDVLTQNQIYIDFIK